MLARQAAGRRQWHEAAQQLGRARDEVDRATYELLKLMRSNGLTWPEIGRELGQTKQRVSQQFKRWRARFEPPG